MRRVFILPLVLGGCAGSPMPATRIVTTTPALPPALLTCGVAPAVPQTGSQAIVARYIVALWLAGQDCRAHVAAIKAALVK